MTGPTFLFRIGGFPSIFYFFDPGKLSGKLIPPTSFSMVFVTCAAFWFKWFIQSPTTFRPENWGTDPIWRAYFSLMIWWVETQPPTSQVIVYFRISNTVEFYLNFYTPQSLRVRPWTWMVGSVGRRSGFLLGAYRSFSGANFQTSGM